MAIRHTSNTMMCTPYAQQWMWTQQCVQCSHWAMCTVHIELVHGAVTQECAPSPSAHRERTVVVNCGDCACCWSSVASQCTAGPTAAPIVSARAGGSLTPTGLIPWNYIPGYPGIAIYIPWYTLLILVHLDITWYTLVYLCIPWCASILHEVPRYALSYPRIPLIWIRWYTFPYNKS